MRDEVVFVGLAQEKAKTYQGRKIDGRIEFTRAKTAYVNHYYSYIDDADAASALARNYPALLTNRDPLWPPLCKAFRLATPRGIRRG